MWEVKRIDHSSSKSYPPLGYHFSSFANGVFVEPSLSSMSLSSSSLREVLDGSRRSICKRWSFWKGLASVWSGEASVSEVYEKRLLVYWLLSKSDLSNGVESVRGAASVRGEASIGGCLDAFGSYANLTSSVVSQSVFWDASGCVAFAFVFVNCASNIVF